MYELVPFLMGHIKGLASLSVCLSGMDSNLMTEGREKTKISINPRA